MTNKAASSLLLACLLLATVSAITTANQGRSSSTASDAAFPLIVEYISDFSIKTNDLDDVIQKQYAQITIDTVKTSYAEVKNPSFTLEYKNTAVPT